MLKFRVKIARDNPELTTDWYWHEFNADDWDLARDHVQHLKTDTQFRKARGIALISTLESRGEAQIINLTGDPLQTEFAPFEIDTIMDCLKVGRFSEFGVITKRFAQQEGDKWWKDNPEKTYGEVQEYIQKLDEDVFQLLYAWVNSNKNAQ